MQETAPDGKAGHVHARDSNFCMRVGFCCHAPGSGEDGEPSYYVNVASLLVIYHLPLVLTFSSSIITRDPTWPQSSISSSNSCPVYQTLRSYRVASSQFTINPASIKWITGSNSLLIYRITLTAVSMPPKPLKAQALQSPGGLTASIFSVWKRTTSPTSTGMVANGTPSPTGSKRSATGLRHHPWPSHGA